MSERDALLAHHRQATDASNKQKLGPLEISRETRYGILAGLWAATFLSALNMLSTISSEFNQANQASWLGTSYLLATCTFTPLYGRLCNVLGRRGANQLAVLFAAVGTLMCGLSVNMNMLIASRFLGGLGGGGIFTTCTIITSDMYSMRARGLTQGIASIFTGLGMGLGGPIGGFISDRFGWRWAFLVQVPLFAISLTLTSINLNYVTPGKQKGTVEVLKRIDWAGTFSLFGAVLSLLFFMGYKFNDSFPWSHPSVISSLTISIVLIVIFVLFELLVAPEPVMAPFLLKERVPVLVSISNMLVAMCNFAIQYFFPMWFQTVMLTSSSIAGAHLLPNSISMSCGSLFAGWMMHKTGRYKMISLTFGIFPTIAGILIARIQPDSSDFVQWFSIIPLGFGNAVVLQTTLIALLAHLPESAMAVGTGFGQLFRGIGQVFGVAAASAAFQTILDRELRLRITGPNAPEIIAEIRHSSRLVAHLPQDLQDKARAAYAISLRAVFIGAMCCTLAAYIVRLGIPEKSLERPPERKVNGGTETPPSEQQAVRQRPQAVCVDMASDDEADSDHVPSMAPRRLGSRRLSTFESSDAGMDLENDRSGGSARPKR